MRALVTGGAGFIGSHIVDALLEKGHTVHVVDDLSTGSLDNVEKARLHGSRFDLIPDRVETTAKLDELAAEADVIFHFAAAVGVRLVVEEPVKTLETNLTATDRILRAASLSKKPFFFASTSEVYGKSTRASFSESDDLLLGPPNVSRWGYACSKAYDEFLAMAYAKVHHLPLVIGRLFNTVGPRQTGQYGMVLPRFVRQAISGRNLTVFGDGRQSRCFCHVNDVVQAILALMDSPDSYGEIYNIGSDDEISVNDLANRVIKLTKCSSGIEHVAYADALGPGFEDMKRRKPDLAKISNGIGFRPERTIDEIILSVIDYQRNL